jgi:hypothetical protein
VSGRRTAISSLALAAAVAIGSGLLRTLPVSAQPARPRLLVILVTDQMRASYVDEYRHRWRGGISTLLAQGAWFTRAEYPYLNTATCAGHVTIGTGALPRSHGIVLNRWWHREEQRAVNCMDDEAAPHVSYGAPAQFGSSAGRVLVPTLADRLRATQPDARVVSVSLKARSAIGLAGHGGDAVTWFDDRARTFVTSRAFANEPVAAVRDFLARHPVDGDLGRVWALQEPPGSYRHPDLLPAERPKAGWTALFPHPLAGAAEADAQYFDRWQKSPFADEYLARMAVALVDEMRLGQRDTTDFLAVSFSALDLMGHDFGPDSREVEDLLIRLDRTIGMLLDALDERVGADNYLVALTADHGAAPTPEQVGGGRIASEDIQQLLEQTLVDAWGPTAAPYVPFVSSGSIYFGRGVFDRLLASPETLDTIHRVLGDVPGIDRVIRSDEVTENSRDPLIRAAAAGYIPGRTADLLLVPHRHWVIELRAENEATNHGTFHDYDRRVPVLLRGPRIRSGRYGDRVTPADVAPTLAYLTGIQLPEADGRPLHSALR